MDFAYRKVVVKNIGGLHYIETEILPGLNVMEQPNASGKTSFLRAFSLLVTPSGIHNDLGYILRSMSSEGFVSIIDKDKNEIRKTIVRNQNNIVVSGQDMFTPEVSELVKRFAIGGSDNEILSAIRSGKNLRSLIAVDTNIIEKLKYEIRVKESELVKFSDELKIALNAPHEKLSAEKKKRILMEEIKELEQKHTILKKQHDSIALSNVENSGISNEKLKAKSSELQQIDSKINDSNRNVESKKEKIEKLSREIHSIRRNLDRLGNVDSHEIDRIDKDVENIEYQIQKFASEISSLDMTAQAARNLVKHLEDNPPTDKLLDALSDDFHVSCPLCGHDSGIKTIKKQIESITEKRAKIQSAIKKLEQDKHGLIKERNFLIQKKSEISEAISLLRSKEMAINQEGHSINTIEQTIDELKLKKEKLDLEIVELSKTINDLFVSITMDLAKTNESIGNKKSILDQLKEEILRYDGTIREIDKKKHLIADLKKEVNDTKSQLHKIELRIQEQFNKAIQEIYLILEFDSNVGRIILDQNYDLVVSRKTDKDSVYRDMDSIKTLSKSELEVIGLTIMISGYIVNNLREYFPCILFDELTFLDPNRLKSLMDYMGKITGSVILTKLPPETDTMKKRQVGISSKSIT